MAGSLCRFQACAVLVGSAAVLLLPATARASGTEEHRALMVAGELLRGDGKLLRARDLLRECHAAVCDEGADAECSEIRAFCNKRLEALEAELPAVEVIIQDDLGLPIPAAQAFVDSELLPPTRTLALDPGHHVLRASYLGRATEVAFDLRRAEPLKKVRAVIDLRRTVTTRPVPRSAVATLGLTGLGVVGFATFGLMAQSDASALASCKPTCDESRKSSLESKTIAADVSLGVAVLAAAGSVLLYLTRPSVEHEERIAPFAGGR